MDRVSVTSSNLVSVGYDESSQTLEVEFKGGAVYQYFDVPAFVHDGLLTAASVGSYFSSGIRNVYRYTRV